MKLNGTHQLLAYVYDVNKLGGSIHTVKENVQKHYYYYYYYYLRFSWSLVSLGKL